MQDNDMMFFKNFICVLNHCGLYKNRKNGRVTSLS